MSTDPTAEDPTAEESASEASAALDDPTAGQPTPRPASDQRPVPDAAELAQIAEPTTVRRAPRYRAFVLTGVIVGAVLAFVLVLVFGGDDRPGGSATGALDVGSGPVLIFTALTLCLVGALLGALVALLLDRRSRR